jgi:hypothetical protein
MTLTFTDIQHTDVQAETRRLADTFSCLQVLVLLDLTATCRPPVHLTPQVAWKIPTVEVVVRRLGYDVKLCLRDMRSNTLRDNRCSGPVKIVVAEPNSRHGIC